MNDAQHFILLSGSFLCEYKYLYFIAADESGTVESEIKYHELHRKFLWHLSSSATSKYASSLFRYLCFSKCQLIWKNNRNFLGNASKMQFCEILLFILQQLNAVIAASMSIKNSQKVKKMLEVSLLSLLLKDWTLIMDLTKT